MKNNQSRLETSEFYLCCSISARLEHFGLDRQAIITAYAASKNDQSAFFSEIMQSGKLGEDDFYRVIAEHFGLIFRDRFVTSRLLSDDDTIPEGLGNIRHALVAEGDGKTCLYLAPTLRDLAILSRNLELAPELVGRIRICSPTMLAQMLRRRHMNMLGKRAKSMPEKAFSADRVLETPQAFVLALVVYCLVSLLILLPWQTFFVWHILLTLFFFGCVLIRLCAALSAKRLPPLPEQVSFPAGLPAYSVLVALYKEAEIVGQLVHSLASLHWPCSKLDIKLICESDDCQTLAAIEKIQLPPFIEVLLVPAIGPRTKPKALNFALQCARGELVTVFDAEDRPHPMQLMEAWRAFQAGGDNLACVQAPLIISNFRINFITRMFAFEYATLFRGLMPWLAEHNLVIPLGGTSNHMRRRCLEEVGAWDAYNVTEDADLGVRFARFGYNVGVISCGTMEDAPENYADWYKQRTRWMKGWMQTFLVHMRNPRRTIRELGFRRFVITQVYMAGLIISAMFHPLMLLTGLSLIIALLLEPMRVEYVVLLGLDVSSVILAYFSYYVLGMKTMEPVELKRYNYLGAIMAYWILLSFAAWRAFIQLMHAPYLWEKTPHRRSRHYDALLLEEARNSLPAPMISWSSGPIASRLRPS